MIQFPKQESNVQLQICLTSKLCIAIIAHMHKECPQFPSCRDLRFPVLYPQPAFFLFLHPLWECTPISARNIKLTNRISRNSLLVVICAFPFFFPKPAFFPFLHPLWECNSLFPHISARNIKLTIKDMPKLKCA